MPGATNPVSLGITSPGVVRPSRQYFADSNAVPLDINLSICASYLSPISSSKFCNLTSPLFCNKNDNTSDAKRQRNDRHSAHFLGQSVVRVLGDRHLRHRNCCLHGDCASFVGKKRQAKNGQFQT